MAIKDTSRKPYIQDNDENVFIGIDLPFRRSNGKEGYFASTSTTIEAIKNNIRTLLNTHTQERLMQPNLGINLRDYLFEQFTDDMVYSIQTDIITLFETWLPFVEIRDIQINMSEHDNAVGKNTLNIRIVFNITRDPNTLESVLVEIGGQ